jgi:hypothetical protein
MRRAVRLFSELGPEQRLGGVIAGLPPSARAALATVADREDLPLVAGCWTGPTEQTGHARTGGCLVANAVRALDLHAEHTADTLDLRILRLLPELSSRDLNALIVAWDEAAEQEGRDGDAALRRLLRGALARAGVSPADEAVAELGPASDDRQALPVTV